MRETGRCLELPFSERGSFCWVKGINASFRLWRCRPTASERWLMWFLPTLGPLRLACLLGLSCSVSPRCRHSHRQVCSPNSCLEEEEVWMLNNGAVIGNWFVHLPTVWARVSRWCLASRLPSTITSSSCLSLAVSSHSTCSSTKTRWRVMPATTTACCATTRPRPSSTSSSTCAPWSTNAARASGSSSACRKACQKRRTTSAPSSPSANALLQIQVRAWSPWRFMRVCLFFLFTPSLCYAHDLSSIGSAESFTCISCQNLHS